MSVYCGIISWIEEGWKNNKSEGEKKKKISFMNVKFELFRRYYDG